MGTNITGIGNANAIGFKSKVTGGIYFPLELKDALVGVWSAYGKSNDSTDRNIIKNKIKDRGGDFIISNAAFKLNSGFGGFVEDFTSWDRIDSSTAEISNDGSKIKCINTTLNVQYLFNYINRDISSFKVKISNFTKGDITYYYRKEDGIEAFFKITPLSVVNSDKVIELPKSYNTVENGTGSRGGFYSSNINIGVTIEQIPSFEGAFVTDGVNDLITSTKTVQEMLGGSNEITVVSMIHGIGSKNAYTNVLRESGSNYIKNTSTADGKTGIYGYTCKDTTKSIITDILGDKNDYKLEHIQTSTPSTINSVFSVAGWRDSSVSMVVYPIAWYWTIIANKVLTTDQINQVIAYFNLDRTLKPDILCNIGKQGITNDNHAEFNDKLIDYSGNGRDIQMYNLAWKGGSGIAAKKFETIKDYNIIPDEGLQELTIYNEFSFKIKSIRYADRYWAVQSLNKTDMSYPVTIITDKDIIWRNTLNYTDADGVKGNVKKETNVPANTPTQVFIYGFNDFDISDDYTKVNCVAYATRKDITEFTVTFIPSCKGGLLLDGVNDFGQFVGDLGLKDYTLIMNRAYNNLINNQVPLISSNIVEDQTPFIVEHWNTGSNAISFSYGASRTTDIPLDINKKIVYQSTYSYMGYVIPKGNAISTGGGITLGKFGNGVQYSAICLWSLMLFPYSMSEFLIERQLKKHKLGTLYPDMVEFRPVIKSNIDIKKINYWDKDWNILHIGDYVSIGNDVKTNITVPNGYKISKVTSNAFDNITIEKSSTDFIYDVKFYGIKKSPQKIGITIEQDENYVLFNPVITSNVEYHKLDFYLNNYQKRINIGDYIPKDAYLRANFYLKNNVDELTVFTFNGVNIDYRRSSVDDTAFNIGSIYNYNFPQEVNITIDEYIRFEDIVQPYPALLRFNDENGNEVSWGGKFKVGSTITRIGSIADPESNLLNGLYSISGLSLNGKAVTSSTSIVEKQMVFRTTATWLLDNNEPKCILSPRLLRIPNSSYKILGHIPDISGHGNHGKINNSAYAGASGANGYPYDYNNSSFWSDSVLAKVVSGELIEYFAVKNSTGFSNITSGVYKGEIKVTGVTKAISENKISRLRIYSNSTTDNELIDITQDGNYNIDIKGVGDANRVFFYAIPNNPNESIVVRLTEPIYIEQVGEYEGAYCLDGVDDFVTIPTLSSGGKQVLMKVNWNTINSIIYDQRGSGGFAIYCSDYNTEGDSITVPAYKGRNAAGTTYIDGIRNEYVIASQLRNVTHNIVEILDTSYAAGNINPIIGKSHMNANYGSLALYDFMLFDDISTEDKIKELNEYVGIEAKVELPPYYWDAYGKTNFDADRDTIQQRGVAVGDYDLTNYNHAYNKMSGYGGYEFTKFDNTSEWTNRNRKDGIEIIKKNGYSFTAKRIGTGQYFYDFQNRSTTILNKSLTVKAVSNNNICIRWEYKYRTAEKPDIDSTLLLVRKAMIPNVPITVALPYKTEQEKADLGVTEGSDSYLFYFDPSDIPVGEEYTVEMLPLYPNGLLYDAVTDYSENVNIPVFTDFTAIMKRKWLKNQGCPLIKGSKVYEGGNGNALLFEWDKAYNFVFYKRTDIMEGEVPENISFITPTNYNGNVITRGSEQDTNGICIAGDGNAGFANMVFYKLILYPKTIPLLQINFLKNLMEKDEIIDLTNPIFIKDE